MSELTEKQVTRAVRRGVMQAFFHLIFYLALIGIAALLVIAVVMQNT